MTSFRFLLGSAALLLTTGAAMASDPVPMGAAEVAPIQYVEYCSSIGRGFFVVPGTDTCLKIGGYLRVEGNYREPRGANDNTTFFRSRTRLEIDARTQTEWGILRSFGRVQWSIDTGGAAIPFEVEKAFIQYIGFTAGRAQSFFDFQPTQEGLLLFTRVSEKNYTNLFAYEAKFGNFKAALSVEESVPEDVTDIGGAGGRQIQIPNVSGGNPGIALSNGGRGYAGDVWPDLIGRISYEGAWGTAQLSGALHQVDPVSTETAGGVPIDGEWGYAVQASAKILMPFLAEGDFLTLNAAYANGAIAFLGYEINQNRVNATGSLRAHNASVQLADGVVDAFGNTQLSEGYTLSANFRHVWIASTLRSNIAVSYTDVDQFERTATALRDFNEVVASANLIWTPTSQLTIGPEIQYRRLDVTSGSTPALPARLTDEEWAARFRIQRDF